MFCTNLMIKFRTTRTMSPNELAKSRSKSSVKEYQFPFWPIQVAETVTVAGIQMSGYIYEKQQH